MIAESMLTSVMTRRPRQLAGPSCERHFHEEVLEPSQGTGRRV